MTIEKTFFRQVLGRFTSGVTIVTTKYQNHIAGMTVSSFTSLSLDPPLILVCVDRKSGSLDMLRASKIFAVNILTAQQAELSRCFATSSPERTEHFCYATYQTAATGAPILDHVLAFIDTRLVAEYPGGDHVIFVGQIEAMGTTGLVSFASDESKLQSKLVTYSEYTGIGSLPSHHSTNGHDTDSPLAYYRSQYRHLAQHYSDPSIDVKKSLPIEQPTNIG